jgi:hypothetical protein
VDRKAWHPAWREALVFTGWALKEEVLKRLVGLLADPGRDDHFRHRLGLALRILAERARRRQKMKEVVEAAWDFWWGLGEDLREHLAPWSEAGPLLARLAPGKVLELAKRLRGDDADARYAAAWALWEMGEAAARPEVIQALTERLRDKDWAVCEAAAGALGKMGEAAATPEVLHALLEYLRDEDWPVRWVAARALERIAKAAATPRVLQTFLEYLRDEDSWVRYAAALTAWHRQGLRFFRDAQGRWTVRTVEELSGGAQLPDGGPRRRQGRARRRRLPPV